MVNLVGYGVLGAPTGSYFFHGYAGGQVADDTKFYDISGAGNDGTFGADLAAPWANAGYVSTEDPTGGATNKTIRLPNFNLDYTAGEKLIGWWLGKITPEGSAVEFIGDGGFNTTYPGWSIRVSTGGKAQFKLADGSNTYFSGSSSATAFDGNLHSLGFVVDGAGRKGYIWVDDALDSNFSSGSQFNSGNAIDTRNANTVNLGTSLPEAAASTTGIVTINRALVLCKLPAATALPAIPTITSVFQALRRDPSKRILASAF